MNTELHDTSLVLMAAGSSTRFDGFKQFADVGPNGEMIWEYSIFEAHRQGINVVVIVTRKELKNHFSKLLKKKIPSEIEVHLCVQELPDQLKNQRSKPLGTGHAVISALPFMRSRNIIINGDDFYGRSAFTEAAKILSSEKTFSEPRLISFPLEGCLSLSGGVSRGLLILEKQKLIEIEEFTEIKKEGGGISGLGDHSGPMDLDPKAQVSMNFWLLGRDFVKKMESGLGEFLSEMENPISGEYHIGSSIKSAAEKNDIAITCIPGNSEWAGLTHPADHYIVRSFLSGKHKKAGYSNPLWSK